MATQINFFYQQYVTTMMTIDEDDNGLFVSIPSESNGESYEVRCSEHADHVDVESCQCQGFHYRKSCKHVVIVQNWYNKIYASSIAKASEKALEQAIDASDLQEEAYEEVALIEQIATTIEDQTPSTVKIVQPVATSSVKKPAVLNETVNLTGATEFDGSRPLTVAEWKAIVKADRKRQQAWQDEYRAKVREAELIDRRGYKSSLSLVG